MTLAIVVTGTDTDVGKTVFAAALAGALGAAYWKPVQAGLEGETDEETVRRLGGVPAERIVPSVYRLATPCSPHRSAEIDGILIDTARLDLANASRERKTLIVEGAGGLMVPLTRDALQIDVFARWRAPTVLCARTALGTINHSLLSIAALKARAIPLIGIAFIGDANEDTERTISEMGEVKRLGRLPRLDPLDRSSLQEAFRSAFRAEDFA